MNHLKEQNTDYRIKQALRPGDQIICRNGDCYTIADRPIHMGGSGILYGVDKTSSGVTSGIRYILKECFPIGGQYERRQGMICAVAEDVIQQKADQLKLDKLRAAFAKECQIGQELSARSDRIIGAEELPQVESIVTGGVSYSAEENRFLLIKEKDQQGAFLSDILEECRREPEKGYPFRTGGLPSVYTTMRIIELVLKALEEVHHMRNGHLEQEINAAYHFGYLHGDIQDGNLYFAGFRATGEKEGDLGLGCLLDFGCARVLYPVKGVYLTEKITDREVYTTPGFTPPEIRYHNDGRLQLTPETDLYSVGCLMRYLLTGEKSADLSAESDAKQVSNACLLAVDCPESQRKTVNVILKRALEFKPENRYHSAGEMLEEVSALVRKLAPGREQLALSMMTLGETVFVGRQKEKKEMEQWFRNRRNPVILYGFGGIGKTELAIEYGRQAEKRNHAHTYLVTFRESMYATVTGPIAQAFGCPVTKERPEEQVYELVMEKLQEHLTEDDLLIIDNVDGEEIGFDVLVSSRVVFVDEKQTRIPDDTYRKLCALPAKLLITTREERDDGIEVGELSERELKELMNQFCKGKVSETDLERLIRGVESHTLAVELIARMLAVPSYPPVTPDEILQKLKEGKSELLQREISSRKDRNKPVEEATQAQKKQTFLSHIRTLFRMSGLSEAGRKMMAAGSLLPPSGMEYGLFAECQEQFDQHTMDLLLARGWLKLSEEGKLCIHMLVREVCQKEVKQEGSEAEQTAEAFLEQLWEQFQPDTAYYAERFQQMAETYAEATGWMKDREGEYPFRSGRIYGVLGEHEKALEYGLKALRLREEALPEGHPYIAVSYNNVGNTYGELGEYEKALEYELKALMLKEEVLPEGHPYIASSYNDVGITYGKLGEHEKALEYKLKALMLEEEVLPEGHPYIASSYNNVGSTYGELGEHEKALKYLLRAYRIFEEILPKNHSYKISNQNKIEYIYEQLGQQTHKKFSLFQMIKDRWKGHKK